jgi:hypothetical protein
LPSEQAKPAASTPATGSPGHVPFRRQIARPVAGLQEADASGSRWAVQDGMLTLSPNDGKDTRGERDIITVETFDLFDLSWDWKIAEGGNSGLKYFVLEDRDSAIGHEYQMIDDARHPDAKIGPHRQTAAFYDVLARRGLAPSKPAGEWNTSRFGSPRAGAVAGSARVLTT